MGRARRGGAERVEQLVEQRELEVSDRDTIGLAFETVACDVHRFEQLAQEGLSEGVPDKLEAAIKLYRGDFLEGFAVRNAPDYELWLAHTQERLREVAVRLLEESTAELVKAIRNAGIYIPG